MTVSLFDVENTDVASLKVRDMIVAKANQGDVREFCQRYHYTKGDGSFAGISWGLWHGITLMGVVSYNNGTRTAVRAVFGDEYAENVWHMGRLAMAEESPHNSESRLIGGSLKAIRSRHPHVWAVLTYAAQGEGHMGYVYQATNALFLGQADPNTYFIDPTGRRRSRHQFKTNVSIPQALERGWTVHREPGKYRYLYILGSKTQRRQRRALLRYPVLPYPKATP